MIPRAVKSLLPNLIPMKNLVDLNVGNFCSRCRGAQPLWAKSSESRSCGSNDNERERRICTPRLRKRIHCVPRCLLRVYRLRPAVSASIVSIASRGVCFECIHCVPNCQPHTYGLHCRRRGVCTFSNDVKVFIQS